MEQENNNGNGEKWIGLYRAASIGMLGLTCFFAQQMYSDIKEQSRDIVTIKVDGAEVKKTINLLEWRVGRLETENHQEKKETKK